VDERGVPLSIVVTGANRHDVTQVEAVLDARLLKPEGIEQNLCADKGYFGKPAEQAMIARGYVPHVVSRGEEKAQKARGESYKARRWVVEACHSWFNRFRKLLVRYEKYASSYEGLLHLAAAMICFRQIGVI
jgi:putative transposase